MDPRRIFTQVLIGVFIFLLLGQAGRFLTGQIRPSAPPAQKELPLLGDSPTFRLIDQNKQLFMSEGLSGRVWIADFIFTSCAGTCPVMTQKMTELQKRLPRAVHLVSISVDPFRDSPDRLLEYARDYGAKADRWHFLTGAPDRIQELVQKGFKLSLAEGTDPEEPIVHSSHFLLVDQTGQIRGYYDSNELKALEKLIVDAKLLLK